MFLQIFSVLTNLCKVKNNDCKAVVDKKPTFHCDSNHQMKVILLSVYHFILLLDVAHSC